MEQNGAITGRSQRHHPGKKYLQYLRTLQIDVELTESK